MSETPDKAPPGWYPHPSMADTQRYWDGKAWTDNIAPAPPPAPAGKSPQELSRTTRKIAWGLSLMFVLPVLFITFLNAPSYGGESCGTWFNPTFTDLEIGLRKVSADTTFEVARIELVADRCNEKLSTQRTLCLVLLGLGIGARVAIPPIVRAARE